MNQATVFDDYPEVRRLLPVGSVQFAEARTK